MQFSAFDLIFDLKIVFIVLYIGTIVPNIEKTDAFNITRLYNHKNLWDASKCARRKQ